MHCLTWHNRSNHLPADSAVVTGGIAGCALTGVAVRGPGGGGVRDWCSSWGSCCRLLVVELEQGVGVASTEVSSWVVAASAT
jgi:hypothetical protein